MEVPQHRDTHGYIGADREIWGYTGLGLRHSHNVGLVGTFAHIGCAKGLILLRPPEGDMRAFRRNPEPHNSFHMKGRFMIALMSVVASCQEKLGMCDMSTSLNSCILLNKPYSRPPM